MRRGPRCPPERTTLSAQDLLAGAVDVDWFRRCHDRLGAQRWKTLDAAAKFASGGGGQRRAQLFSQALLGQVEESTLLTRITTKRHQDSVRALGLLPLPEPPAERETVMLQRYAALREFERGSSKFGSQRQASERAAVRIGIDNLARTADSASSFDREEDHDATPGRRCARFRTDVRYVRNVRLGGVMPLPAPEPHYDSYSEGRAHFKELLDAAIDGRPATVRRGRQLAAMVDAERFREDLARRPSHAEVVAEADGWSVFIPGLPVAGDGTTLDDAIEDMIVALREYADDWPDRLRFAPNHAENWHIVQLVTLSDDGELRSWLTGS